MAACYSNGVSNGNPRLDELFKACDAKGKGLIGPQAFQELCQRFGISSKDSDVIFNDLDHDGDGQIDFEDFSYGFRDFLTPGSRRGSLQLPTNDGANLKMLKEMERKHATAKNAWRHFTSNVGTTNIRPFLHNSSGENLQSIMEELRSSDSEASFKLETALSSLITDVQTLHEEYKTLESSFRKERETHAAQLAALGEELDQQLAKTEAKVKAEARQEAQNQMESERRKIASEMESQMANLSSQMRTFQKVEEWLQEEEIREKKPKSHEELARLQEAESENRRLRSALVEAQMKATMLQSHLTGKQNEYLDLYHELHSEKVASTEYKTQCEMMQSHLSILSEANRVLSDANECFTSLSLSRDSSPSIHQELLGRMSKTNSLDRSVTGLMRTPNLNTSESDRDSGRGTLLEEIQSQGDVSPLPSGIWTTGNRSPDTQTEASPNPSLDMSIASSNHNNTVNNNNVPTKVCRYRKSQDLTHNNPHIKFPQRTFKVILAGDAAVGKTTFIERVCNGYFVSTLSSTIGVDFRVKTIELDDKCVALQLWDTAGQERFRSLTKSYFRRADGVILMYDVTNERTFVSIRQWIQSVEESAGKRIPIVLCGNKIDLREDLYKGATCVNTVDGKKLARQCGAFFVETSPKTGHNIDTALLLLAREMSCMEDEELLNSVTLIKEEEPKTKKRGCCGGETTQTTRL